LMFHFEELRVDCLKPLHSKNGQIFVSGFAERFFEMRVVVCCKE